MSRFMCMRSLEVMLSLERRQRFLQPGVDAGVQLFHVEQFGTVSARAMESASTRPFGTAESILDRKLIQAMVAAV